MQSVEFHSLGAWRSAREMLAAGRYGVIETRSGVLTAVHMRRLPKLLAWPEIWPVGAGYHGRGPADRCLLYYNQPRRFPNFLALKYVVTTAGTRFATFRAAVITLDALAEVKGIDALLCDASNARISPRLMKRWGWESHKPQRWHRNYIKRFYDGYPGALPPLPAEPLQPSPLEAPLETATIV